MDERLSRTEALELASKLDEWPAGLGFILRISPDSDRGWRRDSYRPFSPPPAETPGIKHCPVVQLHERRRAGKTEKNYYGEHLSAWRSIRDAVAETQDMSQEEARLFYNELLRSDPKRLASILRKYAHED